jgi:hypothetical protein
MLGCKDCSAPLVAGENWTEGQQRARNYVCRSCMSDRGKAHYAAHKDRAAQLQRERLRQPSKAKAAAELKSRYYAENREKWKQYRATQKAKEDSDPWHRAARLTTWIRARAGRTGREFDLTHEWVAERLAVGKCEVTGLPLDLARPEDGRFHPWGPSVDRIDCKKGYTQDNCRVVVWIYNMAKSEWSDEVVLQFAKALAAR